jgi:hypothetical protein
VWQPLHRVVKVAGRAPPQLALGGVPVATGVVEVTALPVPVEDAVAVPDDAAAAAVVPALAGAAVVPEPLPLLLGAAAAPEVAVAWLGSVVVVPWVGAPTLPEEQAASAANPTVLASTIAAE